MTSLIGLLLAVAGCGQPVIRQAPTAGEQFQLAKKEFDKKHWLTAAEGFQKVIFNFPGATIVDTAQYYLGVSYFENKDYELAAVEFKRLMTNYPQSSYYDEAQFMTGLSYLKNSPGHYALDQEDLKLAVEALEDFIIDNPDSPFVENAQKAISEARTKLARKQYEAGLLYFKMYDYKAARIYFQYVVDDYTGTDYAALALFRLSEILYKESKLADALEKFNNFIAVYPNNELVPRAKEYVEKITVQLETANAANKS
jgi:outer membrane protein assembly factor BamD